MSGLDASQPGQSTSLPGLGDPLPSLSGGCVYLDYNATTPYFPEVTAAMAPFLSENLFGNPSSPHPYGRATKSAVESARASVAALIGAEPSEVFFCSCGTEADNWAVWGAVAAYRSAHPGTTPHVVTSAVEHPAVLEHLTALRDLGLATFTAVGVDSEGRVSVDDIKQAIKANEHTCLVTLMHSNNESGALQPVAEAAAAASAAGVLIHSDAAQSIGKVEVNVEKLGVDMLTVVGHKFGAPKGVAALYVSKEVQQRGAVARLLCGGGQERGLRAGTENVILIVGLGKAAEIAAAELPRAAAHMAQRRAQLEDLIKGGLPEGTVRVNGTAAASLRLPNTLSVSLKGVQSSALLAALSEELAASAGAACHSDGGAAVSSVLQAMGIPQEWALGTLRLSVGRHTTEEEVVRGAELILKEARRLMGLNR